MNPFEFFEDAQAKQHINLSSHAWDIIEQDIMEFENKSPDKISGFINHVLEIYLRDGLFPADITSSIDAYKHQQLKWLKNIHGLSEQQITQISSSLTEKYITSLLKDFHVTKGIGRKFDVNNACRTLLKEKGDYGYEVSVFQKRGNYINTILENYASLPMANREDIYFTDRISELEYCINKRQVLYLTGTYRSEQLIPYKIMHDKYNMHTYLIAIPYVISSRQSYLFRISQIKTISKTNTFVTSIPKDTILTIENEIKQKGVQYLPGETQKIQIRLTPAGQSMYHRITFQRPVYEPQTNEEREQNIFTFLCTPYQAYIYFKAFGSEAEILSPKMLRDDVITFYESALSVYQ